MAFFKTTRDQLKANALVSHLEFAKQFFRPGNTVRCESHLKSANKALGVVRQAKAEYIFSDEGWQYVAQLAAQLHSQLVQHGCTELARIASEIGHRACVILGDREDPISEAELESYVEPAEEPPPPRVLRDPFNIFPPSSQ
jgi:hypothetical protein